MELDYFTEEPVSSSGKGSAQHYFFNKADGLIIQSTPEGFCLRNEIWLRSYLQTVLVGNPLPGFTHHGKIELSEEIIRPMIEGLSYKAYVEQKLAKVNKALAMQGERIMSSLPSAGVIGA
jgi:hypothetical protein